MFSRSKYRDKRFKQFRELFSISLDDKILDAGGNVETWIGTGLEKNVTILNLFIPDEWNDNFKCIIGDVCDMKNLPDNSFDIVFSNSVIEHVGDYNHQQSMANEIKRVAKKYWVQTPNKHFPIEMHFLFPFFQYFPEKIKLLVAKYWPFSFAKIYHLDPIKEAKHIWLLEKGEIAQLFDGGVIISEKILGISKSFVAYQK